MAGGAHHATNRTPFLADFITATSGFKVFGTHKGRPISIDGLWSLFFGTFLNSDADTLYFTAGPNNQTNGLFGSLVAQVRNDADDFASK